MRYKLVFTLIVFVISLMIGCSGNTSQEVGAARTYYESLDLDTPESAVDTFTGAFQREDYYTVFLVLSPSTQLHVENNINTLDYGELIKLSSSGEAKEILDNTPQFQMINEWEHLGAASIYLFDNIMLAAKQHSAFLIDLSKDNTILHSEPSGDPSKVSVYVDVEGIEGEVVFRVEQSATGRWRVVQVIVPGGDEDLIPWSVMNN